ncbi:molecular chaperone [Pseudomonas sp. S60]|uniref:fimbrial biogenesis chaperone n=1 Tax=Pseudomonas sp. S60 TaxID=211124 RepID=UPI001911F5A2|nr:molecular chaperone [Pseudomonas sp. S60]MBK5011282.1 molecular chaperone [Pseudomonas sp. S60]
MPSLYQKRWLWGSALFALVGLPCTAQAALITNQTRIIHGSDKASSSINVANPSTRTYAAQAWVNTEADDITTPTPLLASPSLFRLAPNEEQIVKINRLPNDLPQDRESLFFLNVQEIPQVEEDMQDNALTIALRTRLKVFYRPSQLKGQPQDHLKQLDWSLQKEGGQSYLMVNNPSPYHFTFGRVEIDVNGKKNRVETKAMAMPMNQQRYKLEFPVPPATSTLTFTTINDYGGSTTAITVPLHGHVEP